MYCKYLSRALNGKLRCKFYKRVIILDECKKCLIFHPRENKPIKKKSDKLKKIENDRYSILTKDLEKCFCCDNKRDDIHEIFKGANRLASMKNGFCVPLCRKCHERTENDLEFYKQLQKKCIDKYLQYHSLQELKKIIGKYF